MRNHIPLYRAASTLGGVGNAGLRFNKFCAVWRSDWSLKSEDNANPKKDWIDKFSNGQNVGDENELKEIVARNELLQKATNGNIYYFKTMSPFVTGLGNSHPVENGFTWHHTLGVPYCAGSSIKGLVREWADNWLSNIEENCWSNEQEKSNVIARIFGTDNKENPVIRSTGSVVFLDAIPTKPVKLKTEIMTPHYGEYYQDASGETPPGDWLSPVPIPFLAVDVGQIFQFSIMLRKPDGIESDLLLVSTWLRDALYYLGCGAKTSVGYGIMVDVQKEKEKMQKQDDEFAEKWLAETIEKIISHKDFQGQPLENAWKKSLSEEWLRLKKDNRRELILSKVKSKWRDLGLDWNNPNGGSAKNAKRNFEIR